VRAATARHHVFRKGGEARKLLFHARGDHERTSAAAARQQPLADQCVDRLAHGDARDVEFLGKFALGRDGCIGLDDAILDRVAQALLELEVERRGVFLVQAPDALDE
jgi:hypothetical protein